MAKCDTKLICEVLEMEAKGLRRALLPGVAIESASEECEQASLACQRELSLALFDRTSQHLRDIEAALQRMEDGVFGACVDCHHRISAKRLTAIPWASRCLRCEQAGAAKRAGRTAPTLRRTISLRSFYQTHHDGEANR